MHDLCMNNDVGLSATIDLIHYVFNVTCIIHLHDIGSSEY